MAGGSASDIRAPYPKGEDSLVCLTFGPFDVPDAAQTDEIVEKLTIPFGFKAVRAEVTALAVVAGGTTFTVNLQDDTGTPQVLIADAAVADVSLGAGSAESLTVVKTITVNAGAVLSFTYTSVSGDTAIGVKLRVWVKPIN